MFQIFSTLVFLFTALFFTACGAEKKAVAVPTQVLPSWYKTPPLSNSSDLYALGEGKNKEEAIANALNLMASSLSVSVSSSYNAKTVVKEGRVNSSEGIYANEVQSSVKEIRISSYELLKAESLGFKKYAVLLKSNKKKLFDSLLQELKQNFKILAQKEKTMVDANGLKQLSFYANAKKSLQNLPNTLIIMNVLNPTFNSTSYLQSMQEINVKYDELLANLSFSIHSDKNSINLKAPLAKGLSAKKLKIKKSGAKMHFSVYIKSKIEEANSYGFSLARSDISIVTMDSTGTIVGSNALNIVGQSSQGYDIAKQNIVFRLNALIEKEGIAKVMGLDI
jgi:LPP20 lipoprotein